MLLIKENNLYNSENKEKAKYISKCPVPRKPSLPLSLFKSTHAFIHLETQKYVENKNGPQFPCSSRQSLLDFKNSPGP